MNWKRSTPKRSQWLEATACGLALVLAASASAQRLQFTNDDPAANSGKVAAKLASDAKEAADKMTDAGGSVAAAKKSYLRAVAALLEAGEAKGVSGTYLVIAGEGLARSRDEVFAVLDASKLADADVRLLDADLSQLIQSVPASSEALDRALRDAFANVLQVDIAQQVSPNGSPPSASLPASLWPWPELPDAVSPHWPDMAFEGEDAAALNTLHERITLGEQWIAYRPGARSLTRLVMDASWPFGHEKQIAAALHKRWLFEFSLAAREIVNEKTGATGLARLRCVASLGRIFALLEKVQTEPGVKELTKALTSATELMPDDPPASGPGVSRLAKLEQWLMAIASRAKLSDDKLVVRQLRPAFRSISDLCKATQAEALEALVKVANKQDASGDPGVMAAVNLHAETLDLLKLLHRASAALEERSTRPGSGGGAAATGEPVARENAKALTDGLLKLAKDVADPKQRDRALPALRNLATDVADLSELPGERRLREKDAALESVLGGKGTEALEAIDRERAAWRKNVGAVKASGSSTGEANAARLRAFGIVLAVAVDAADCRAAASAKHDALQNWGGWWLDETVLQSLSIDAATALPSMLRALETDPATGVLATAQRFGHEHSVVALAAKVSRELASVSGDGIQANPLTGARAIATGTPDAHAVLFAAWRERLATICRYAQEGAAGNEIAGRFATKCAAELLDAMDRSAR